MEMGIEMKNTLKIVQVLDLDESHVELTLNTILNKKTGFDMDKVIGGDLMHMRKTMVEGSPKMFKIVVPYEFYKKNNLNIREVVNVDVNI
jgi:hypothetical protein